MDKKEVEYYVTTAIYNILYVNDLACSCIVDLADFMKKEDKETRRIYSALRKRQIYYDIDIQKMLHKEISFFAEYNSQMDIHVHPKLEEFTNAIENVLKENNVDNARFIALTETARTIIGYSVLNIENRIKECLQYEKDCVNLRQYKLKEILCIIEDFSDWVSRKCRNIDLNKSEEVMTAYRNLDKILTNSEIINKSIFEARNCLC